MTIATDALAILDRWENAMNHPEGRTLEIHHQDIAVLKAAVTGGYVRKRKPDTAPNLPILTVGTRSLNLTRSLMDELRHVGTIMFVIANGYPMIKPYPDGWAVVPYTKGKGYGGMITAPTLVCRAQNHLPKGSRWLMQRDGDCWRGTAQIRNP